MKVISQSTRARIIEEFIENKPASLKPELHAMCGIPGSGKSTYVQQAINFGRFPEKAFLLNPDIVMEVLPEYHQSVKELGYEKAFEAWEMPTRAFAYELFGLAADKGLDIIIDMGCVREEDFKNISDLKQRGYTVHMYHVDCIPEVALDRIQDRDRHTPRSMVMERHQALKEMLPKYQDLAHHFYSFNNTDLAEPFMSQAPLYSEAL